MLGDERARGLQVVDRGLHIVDGELQAVVFGNEVCAKAVVVVVDAVEAIVAYVAVVARLTVAGGEDCMHDSCCVFASCYCWGVIIGFVDGG